MAAAVIVLSQPTTHTTASNNCPRQTSSIESAITSRLTRDARIPSVPMVSPSLMAIVLNSIGGRHANGVQHDCHQRWRNHGNGGNARVPGEPRSDCGFD